MKKKSAKAVCPCCKSEREPTHMKRLLESEQEYNRLSFREDEAGWTLQAAKSNYLKWACDLCITKRRAV